MTHELGPLPEPDGSAEVNQQPLPGGGYSCEAADAWSEPLVRAYALAEVQKAVLAERERLTRGKLWLWRNHVDGRPEYWAFTNPYPINMDNGDPQTLGQPCGYAIFKPSRDGSNGRTEAQVLAQMTAIRKGEA